MVINPARGQLNRESFFFFVPVRAEEFDSRETCSTVPSRVSRLILHIQTEPGAYSHGIPPDFRGGVHLLIPPSTIGSVPSLSVTQWHTDDVHRRESDGSGPVVVKAVPVMGAAFSGFTMDPVMCAPLLV